MQFIGREHGAIRVPRGKTWSGGKTTISSGDYGDSTQYEGTVVVWRAKNSSGLDIHAGSCIAILVRNSTGSTLSGGDAVSFASGYAYKRVGAKVYQTPSATVLGDIDGIVDDRYGSAAVPSGDLFWLVVAGTVYGYTGSLAGAENLIPERTWLVASSQAGSTSTYAGRLAAADFNCATAVLGNTVKASRIRALSAKTTSNTNTQILVEISP